MDTRNGNNESSDGTTGEKINNGIAFIYQLCYNYVTKVITSSKYIKRGVICTDKFSYVKPSSSSDKYGSTKSAIQACVPNPMAGPGQIY